MVTNSVELLTSHPAIWNTISEFAIVVIISDEKRVEFLCTCVRAARFESYKTGTRSSHHVFWGYAPEVPASR